MWLNVTESGAKKFHSRKSPGTPGTRVVLGRDMRFTWEDDYLDLMRMEDDGRMSFLGNMTSGWDGPPASRLQAIRVTPPKPEPPKAAMPLSRADLPRIAERVRQLIRGLETLKPSMPAHSISQAGDKLLEALMPSGVDRYFGGDRDITSSGLDVKVKAGLKDLRRFLLERPIVTSGRHWQEETIVFLRETVDALVRPGSGIGAPRKNAGAVDHAIEMRKRRPRPTWKDVWKECEPLREDDKQARDNFNAAVMARERQEKGNKSLP